MRITTVIVSVQHKDTDINKLADLWTNILFPLAALTVCPPTTRNILNPSEVVCARAVRMPIPAPTRHKRSWWTTTRHVCAPRRRCVQRQDATKVDRSGAHMARYIAKTLLLHLATRCRVTLAYAIGQAEPVMVDVNTFGTCDACEDDCLAAAVRKSV